VLISFVFAYSLCIYASVPIFIRLGDPEDLDPNNPLCDFDDVESSGLIVYWTDLLNLILISFSSTNSFTLTTCLHIFRTRKHLTSIMTSRSRTRARDRKFAINSIVIDLLNLTCITPLIASLILSHYLSLDKDTSDLFVSVGNLIYAINASSSFLVNITVNSIFYKQFCQMIKEKRAETQITQSIELSNINK
jgi:hypothetical protein